MANPSDPLETLKHDIASAQKEHEAPREENGAATDLGSAMRLGVELLAGIIVGCALGYFIDKWLGTMPVFFIICFFLGAVAGFRNLLKSARMNDKTK